MTYYYATQMKSNIENAENIIKTVLNRITPLLDDDDLYFDLRLILNELIINGCKHGNCFDENKKVALKLSMDETKVEIIVKDEGKGLDYDFSSYDCYSSSCTGRGLKIVKELTNELIISGNNVIAIINR